MPMLNPSHPGPMIRDSLEAVGWTVKECAERLGVARESLSRVLNGNAAVSPRLGLALERIGWSNAEHWLRVQAGYDQAQERRRQAA